MNIKKEFLKAGIEDLKKRKEKALQKIKELKVTIRGLDFRIKTNERMLK